MFKLALASLLSLAAAVAVTSGCDTVTAAYDCDKICDRYKECFNTSYDAEACANRCEDNAATSESYDDKAEACESCIDDKSCTGAFECAGVCNGVVP